MSTTPKQRTPGTSPTPPKLHVMISSTASGYRARTAGIRRSTGEAGMVTAFIRDGRRVGISPGESQSIKSTVAHRRLNSIRWTVMGSDVRKVSAHDECLARAASDAG